MAKSKSGNFFVWAAAGLLLVGGVGFGATGLSGTIRSIGTVGDLPLSAQQYFNELNGEINAISAQLQAPLSFADAAAARIPEGVRNRLVARRVIENEAWQLGLSVGDDAVAEEIASDPAFTGPAGGFDRLLYTEQLARIGLNEQQYESQQREQTAAIMLQSAVVAGLPDQVVLAENLSIYIGQERDFTWAVVDEDLLTIAQPEFTDADLQAWYEAHPEDFTTPETRIVAYALLSPQMLQGDIEVDEADLEALYQSRIDEYVQPERRLVERLVFSTEDAATEALAAIEAGETSFDQLTEDRGLTLDDIDIGAPSEAELGDAGPAIFDVDPDTVVGPFESEFGPALFRMNAILSAQEITYDEIRDDLLDEWTRDDALRLISVEAERINDLMAGGAGLSDLAEQTDMELGDIALTPDAVDGLAAYADFRDAAAAAQEGDFPELLELEDGGLVAYQLTELRAPALRPFDEVRQEVETAFAAEATLTAIRERAAELASQITPETEFTDLGLDTAVAERGLTRRAFLNGTPPEFISQVFDMAQGETRVVNTDTGAIIVRLDAINLPDPEDDAVIAEREAILDTAGAGIAQDLLQYYTTQLQMQTDVKIDNAAIEAIHVNFQ